MENKVQFIDLGQLSSRKELLTTNDKYKCVQFNFETGEGLSKHRHNGYATVIVLKGSVKMSFEMENIPLADDGVFELTEKTMLSFDARVVHELVALTPAQILVILSAPLS